MARRYDATMYRIKQRGGVNHEVTAYNAADAVVKAEIMERDRHPVVVVIPGGETFDSVQFRKTAAGVRFGDG